MWRQNSAGNLTEKQTKHADIVHRAGSDLLQLINDVLDLAKIEAGRMEMRFEATDLNSIVSSCVGIIQPQANAHRVLVRTQLAQLPQPVIEKIYLLVSADDAALNRQIARFAPDAQAVRRFAADVDHAGRFALPVLTTHGIGDSTVFVEGSDTLRQRMVAAGHGDRLVQTFVDSNQHSYWGDAMYPPLFEALLGWVDKGQKPSPAGIAERCRQLRSAQPADCRFLPTYTPQPLATRVVPR